MIDGIRIRLIRGCSTSQTFCLLIESNLPVPKMWLNNYSTFIYCRS